MVSSKYSSRRHIPQRPPICNPPIARPQIPTPPPWPPSSLRLQGTITNNNESRSLSAIVVPTQPQPGTQIYYKSENGLTLQIRLEISQERLYVDYFYGFVGYSYVYATGGPRQINPALPISQTFPPWSSLTPPTAQAELIVSSA
jgi:hypothetical protein